MHIECRELGIDSDHVHFVLDVALHPIPEIVKALKGYTAKVLLREFPIIRRQYVFHRRFWNPSYYFDSLGSDLNHLSEYVRNQGKPKLLPGQKNLADVLAA
jgi:putative transposase